MSLLSHPLWRSFGVQIAVCVCLGALAFFSSYDFAWRPHDTLELSLLGALFVAVLPILSASSDWIWARIWRLPLEWGVLFRLQIALAALFLPLSLAVFEFQQFYATWNYGTKLTLVGAGASLTLWALFLWHHTFRPERARRLAGFLASSAFCWLCVAMWSADEVRPLAFAAQNWEEVATPRVRLFYVDKVKVSRANARGRAGQIETMLGRVEKTLNAPRVSGKINVFLFPDETALADFVGDEDYVGQAGQCGLAMLDGDWESMRATAAHELSHLVLAREFGPNCRTVLDEGTAVWIENRLAPGDDTIAPERQKGLTTAQIASDAAFTQSDDFDKHYAHAGWLAKTFIERDGLAKWKRLLKVSRASFWQRWWENDDEAGADLRAHFRAVYGRDLP